MSRIKSKGNITTEMDMVSAFRKCRIKGWRRHVKIGSCRPDFVFFRSRIALFVDGCFWHMCPEHGSTPSSNRRFWKSKLKSNLVRDRRNEIELSSAGWCVLRFWEHSVKKDALGCAKFTAEIISFDQDLNSVMIDGRGI